MAKTTTFVKRLYRSRKDKVVGGVCGGIAEYLDVDPVVVRLIWAIATLISMGLGILAYIIAWIIIPEEPKR
ncbi:MAG TPA: PspC domain-containing protein [Candidatus Nanoarchaeia archaeon]|nr:PspC domain-containing protein [Candidatus Nanoarchaeia archaeon]